MTHRWGEAARFEHKSERECRRCGLVKVTRHEAAAHWTEFWRDGEKIAGPVDGRTATPACLADDVDVDARLAIEAAA